MIIIMQSHAADEQIDAVKTKIESYGLTANVSRGVERTIIGAIGDERQLNIEALQSFPGVENVMRVVKHYQKVAR